MNQYSLRSAIHFRCELNVQLQPLYSITVLVKSHFHLCIVYRNIFTGQHMSVSYALC